MTQEEEMSNRLYETLKHIDDNDEIIELLKARLELGRSRYNHGVRVDDNVTDYGPVSNDWELMALEEALDGMIYSAAAIIRIQRKKAKAVKNVFPEGE